MLLDGISFLVAALLIYFIVPVSEEVVSDKKITLSTILNDLKMGFQYVFSHKQIFMIIILSAIVNFFLSAYNLLLPYSSQMFCHLPNGLYGTFLTMEAIGGLLGAISAFIYGNFLLHSHIHTLTLFYFLV